MKILICGSRHFKDYELLEKVLDEYEGRINTIIHGMARGADILGGKYAKLHSIEVLEFPALWGQYGNRAGPIRNAQMLREGLPDLVIAFRGPNSRGTQNMINQARKAGIETKVIEI